MADPLVIDDFSAGMPAHWRYVSDQVMGGVSEGSAQMHSEDGQSFARLQGQVSTENNGGFIQIRRDLDAPFAVQTKGLRLRVRGNGADYFVHLRPRDARRPWQFFQARFATTGHWQDVFVDWSDFAAKGGLHSTFDPTAIRSLGLVAYGAAYQAQLDVLRIAVE